MLVFAGVTVVATGCVHGRAGDPEAQQERRAVVNETAGAYRGVRLGDSEDDVRRVFGEPGAGEGFFPLGESFGEIGGAPTVRNWPPRWRGRPIVLRYEDVAFLVGPRGVFAVVVTEDGATTRRGVRIGDALARARLVYGASCGVQPYGEALFGQRTPSCRWCRATIRNRIRIWFGRDPIRSITVARVGPGLDAHAGSAAYLQPTLEPVDKLVPV